MKSFWVGVLFVLLAIFASYTLSIRLREEQSDDHLILAADWSEIREVGARLSVSDQTLLHSLREKGVLAIVIPQATIQDYVPQHMTFERRETAQLIRQQLSERRVTRIEEVGTPLGVRLIHRGAGWERLKAMMLGFNPDTVHAVLNSGLHPILRVDNDPWVSEEHQIETILGIIRTSMPLGIYFNSDTLPGGQSATGRWATFIRDNDLRHLLFEFKPSKAARMVAARVPERTYRAHTIGVTELKDIPPPIELSRWSRAARERTCRFLLVRMSPDDSWQSYLSRLESIGDRITQDGFVMGWPASRSAWKTPSYLEKRMGPLLALIAAILTPLVALKWGKQSTPKMSFFCIFVISLLGGSLVAALADQSLTRLQVVPFRGIKLAVLLSWVGSFFILFRYEDMARFFKQTLKRADLLILFVICGVLAYLVLRTGNASASLKMGWEQRFRELLEQLFVARPRFKEFALGYPLLYMGLHMERHVWGRLLIGVGMIGPISLVNTFCHLHSPLYLAYWRSINGALIGALLGLVLVSLYRWQQAR